MAESVVTVVDYGAGNVGSVLNMLKRAGVTATRAKTPDAIESAQKLILPGVGAFDHCMRMLTESGLRPALEQAVLQRKIPTFGVCVGFQMLFASSEEGQLPGLGWLKGKVVRFDQSKLTAQHKVPHMGWNSILPTRHRLFAGIEAPRFYFVHSYHALPELGDSVASCHYGYDFCCAAEHGTISGVQFHPEKSHKFGMQLLKNFAEAA